MNTLTWYDFDMASCKVINFTIDSTSPQVTLIHPLNETYETPDVPLNFVLNEPFSLVTFSLDGQDNVTLTENTTLTGLSKGAHNITVYATDMAGNPDASETLLFSVSEPDRLPTELVVAVSIGTIALAAAGLLVYLKKRKAT